MSVPSVKTKNSEFPVINPYSDEVVDMVANFDEEEINDAQQTAWDHPRYPELLPGAHLIRP